MSWWTELQAAAPWLEGVPYVLAVLALAWLAHLLSERAARALVRRSKDERGSRPERMALVASLVSDAISLAAFLAAGLAIIVRLEHVQSDDLLWVIGLLSVGFGLAARPLIADYFAGLSFIFDDRFAVGEKVLLQGLPGGDAEGVVERVALTSMRLRAQSGELIVVPNGEVRVVRNFSRGLYSMANVRLRVRSVDLERTLEALDGFREEAVVRIGNLIEPWEVISEEGLMEEDTVLTLVIKARFGMAATLRPRILAFLQKRLSEAEISLVE